MAHVALVTSSGGISVTDFIIKSGSAMIRDTDLSVEVKLYPVQWDHFLILIHYRSTCWDCETS